jgi:hypothetical protein
MMIKEKPRFAFVLLIIIVCCLTGCSSSNEITTIEPIDPQTTPVTDTVSIYCQLMPKFGDQNGIILIQDKTELRLFSNSNIDKDMNFARHGLTEGRDESIYQDFKNRNRGPEPLVEQLACEGSNIQIVKSEKLAEIFKKADGWGSLRKEFPGHPVIVVLSEIGFNEAKDRALVFMEWSSSGLSGSGDYYLMIKQDSEWRVAKEAHRWAS